MGAALVTACAMGAATAAAPSAAPPAQGSRPPQCLADGSGSLRARLRGALTADLDWRDGGLECEGGMRPDGHGLRVSFAGALTSGGATHRLRFIFGIAATGEGRSGRALPANVTLILEGERRMFSTRGDDKCTIDDLRQDPLERTPRRRDYRVAAHGFCVEPATSLTGGGRVLVSRFDFVGRISLYGEAPGASPGTSSKSERTAAVSPTPGPAHSRRPLS